MQVKSIVNLLLACSLAVARPLEHAHHQHDKRGVVVVTKTIVVDGSTVEATAAAQVQEHAETFAESTPSAVVSSSSAPSSASSASAPASSGSFSAGTKGVTYSPYQAGGGCKTAEEVASDLSQLTGYEIIRLYGVDCNQVENVFKAKAPGQKLFLGIFFVDAIESGVSAIASAVKSYGSWDDVHTVSVGNELVNNGEATVSQIGQYVSTAKSALRSAGFTGPVLSVDTFIAVINNPGLCDFADEYVAVNAHAFFDGGIAASGAGDWAAEQIQRVSSACGGKDVLIVESGWPSKGDTNGAAVPSKSNQQAAVQSLGQKIGSSCIAFNAFNDYWKADGPFNAEKYWGILDS
ncbi:Putative glucanase [Komagataella phaffii CBS 7435]|uniref:Cell wall protein with similarity to glucanases n=2 Tax=Komagataella phaffii TaxID=460519 RepID=C4QVL7_KOMPG|nr:uncharacterized protein PAS_chr1-3_0229 [Komagataella phaffii GS115]AOA61426.1 GQ67_02488T0 [Komagataella phaffii]CAH2445947.1 Putative glucanase [Komagataella phaffii CBS 7435]AOA66532.1 GQ68_02759T0 [Komagataella phaffii GS115]CAY67290.1 Cell wall protein with similarity to glucanases [Komagataella phaffii GS115]CCA36394.1 Putative glucanase [Komagataella phaffii CBS 7435]